MIQLNKHAFLVFVMLSTTLSAFGVTTSGRVTLTVLSSLSITEMRSLEFSSAVPGSTDDQILPTDENSSVFKIQGIPGMNYQIQLPGEVLITTAGGTTPEERILVDRFSSYPAGSGALNEQGEQTLYIGATRNALSVNQAAGSYVGTFSVTIVY